MVDVLNLKTKQNKINYKELNMENKIIINGKIVSKILNKKYNSLELIIVDEKDGRKISNKVICVKTESAYPKLLKMKKDEQVTLLVDCWTFKNNILNVVEVMDTPQPTSFEFFGKVEKFAVKNGSTNSKDWERGEYTVTSVDANISLTLTIWNNLNKIIIENKNKLLKFSGYTKICYNQFYDNYYTDIIIKDVKVVENNEGKNA